MELDNKKLSILVILSFILSIIGLILSITFYIILRNKKGPRGPRGKIGPRGPRGPSFN